MRCVCVRDWTERSWIAGGVLEAVLVHGIQPGASAAEAIPLKSIILMAWASHSTPVATKHASDAELRQLVSIVTAVVSATHVMVLIPSGCARPGLPSHACVCTADNQWVCEGVDPAGVEPWPVCTCCSGDVVCACVPPPSTECRTPPPIV